jgi:HKD family nuclease
MNLILHTPNNEGNLHSHYQRAFSNAVELFIVTAYLTDWDTRLELNSHCRRFRIVIGRDFGITRKAACEKVMEWLPKERKWQFKVADQIAGFHPKAVFWKEANGHAFAIVGSSNLTRAAFETNYEANIYCPITASDYEVAKAWVRRIEKGSVVVSEDWLKQYNEGARVPSDGQSGRRSSPKDGDRDRSPLVSIQLPRPRGLQQLISERRRQLRQYQTHKAGLVHLFRLCASGGIDSKGFYEQLPDYWSGDKGDRLQGKGWEIKGMHSDFQFLAKSLLRIIDADDGERDDIVAEELDRLARAEIPTRKAFLSEMLCLNFPNEYPVLNRPVHRFLSGIKFRAPRGASEGAAYVDLATKLRSALLEDPNHPAKNLAELDYVIWGEYGREAD